MKRNTNRPQVGHATQYEPAAVTIEDDGLSVRGFAMLALSAGTLIVCVALAVAVWKVATGIQWALIIIAGGSAAQMALTGLGVYRRQELAGRAQLESAKGNADAERARGQAALLAARKALPGRQNKT